LGRENRDALLSKSYSPDSLAKKNRAWALLLKKVQQQFDFFGAGLTAKQLCTQWTNMKKAVVVRWFASSRFLDAKFGVILEDDEI
jgi:Myb/SANT-like DNA-binding domain